MDDWENLKAACCGFEGYAEDAVRAIFRLRQSVIKGKRLDPHVSGNPGRWRPFPEIEENLSSSSSHPAIGAYGNRFAGMRQPWTPSDPEVSRIRTEILKTGTLISPPDSALPEPLQELGKIEQSGHLVTCDGIPIPVGKGQIKDFVAIRWPYVGEQLNLYTDDHKALKISHDCLERLLTYSPRIHCENLVELQKHHLPLFWAVWRRDFRAIRRILWKVDRKQLQKWLFSAEKLTRSELKGQRLPNESRITGALSDPALRLKYGTALLSELERLCEILECLHRNNAITREASKQFLKESTSIAAVIKSNEPVGIFLASTAAQIRGSHQSMNMRKNVKRADPDLRKIDRIVKNTTAYSSDKPRLSKPFGGKPALYFIGIEQQLIPLVAMIMLFENMKRIEGNYRRRREKGSSGTLTIENELVRVAAVIAAHVHPRWAKALLNSPIDGQTDEEWLKAGMPGKPTVKGELTRIEIAELPAVGDRNHTRLYNLALKRIKKLPKISQHGWTRGFFFEAWLQPNPEKFFLKKCATLQRFSKAGRIAHERQMTKTAAQPIKGFSGSADTTWTGLPKENPVETQHNRMRPFIDQIQVPDKLPPRFWKVFDGERDIIVAEVVKLFPAVTPFTLDPYLHEQITTQIDKRTIEFAVEAAWHTTFR